MNNLNQLLLEQKELAQILSIKCEKFDANREIGTPLIEIIEPIETGWKRFLAKEPIIKSYSTEPTVKQYLEENNYEQLSLKIHKTTEKILDFQSKTIADISTINNNFKKD
jgi:hypothetical protein